MPADRSDRPRGPGRSRVEPRTGVGERRVDELFDPALRRLGVRGQVREAQVREVFAEVVGPGVAGMCHAVSLERGALLVATTHTALAHQLQIDAPRLIEALNRRLGADAVRRLRFTAA